MYFLRFYGTLLLKAVLPLPVLDVYWGLISSAWRLEVTAFLLHNGDFHMKDFFYNIYLIAKGIAVIVFLYILAMLSFVAIGGIAMDMFPK